MNSKIEDNEHSPIESLKESLQQMKLIREGKIKAKTWQEYRNEKTIKFEKGQTLIKNYDKREVTIAYVGDDYIMLNGDFEPNHIVMKDKVLSYYSLKD